MSGEKLASAGGAKREKEERVMRDKRLLIAHVDVPRRCSQEGRLLTWSNLHGCYTKKQNVCRDHGVHSEDTINQVDSLTHLLVEWQMRVGRERLELCEELLWMHDRTCPHGGAGGSSDVGKDMIVLVGDSRWQPRMTYHVPCHLQGSSRDVLHFNLPAFPFIATMAVSHPRMDRFTKMWKSLHMLTSDELALTLGNLLERQHWALIPLIWEEVEEGTILNLRVVGAHP